ncbi:hypothetical protein K8S17_01020 [bacterium]|nr:hypothetical protein [bacterium]
MRFTATMLAVVLVLAVLSAPTFAAGDEVTIQVTSIAAASLSDAQRGSDGAAVDKELAGHAQKLRALFAYNRYAFLGDVRTKVDFGSVARIKLPEHFALEVEMMRFEREGPGSIEMMVTLIRDVRTDGDHGERGRSRDEIVLRTRIRLENGGTVLLGGPPISGGVLILALSARQ